MEISTIKTIIGIVAVALTFVGYIPYSKDILKGKTKPHLYSWVLWGLVTGIVFGLQITNKAGPGSFITLTAALMCFLVIILGVKFGSVSKITNSDKVFLFLALVALVLWLVAKQPLLSVLTATAVDLLGFAPTIRKSWSEPFSETLSFYYLNTARFGIALLALSQYTVITALYPIMWLIANGLFAIMLNIRRKQIK